MIVKVSIPGTESKPDLSQFTGNDQGEFGSDRFCLNDGVREADAWFIFEDVVPDDSVCEVPDGQVFFVSAEASWPADYYLSAAMDTFLSQFDAVASCHPTNHRRQLFEAPFLPWMVNANHRSIFRAHLRDINFLKDFQGEQKTRPLSVFCSNQTWTADHRLRLAFVSHLKKELGDDLDWFGNGVNELDEKWDGLATYERTIVLENRQTPQIYTEKILDPFLAFCQPIYYGDPTLVHRLPLNSSQLINIRDFQGATQTIRSILKSPVVTPDQEALSQGKKIVLDELHFLGRAARLAKGQYQEIGRTRIRTYQLAPKNVFTTPSSLRGRIVVEIENAGRKVLKKN